MAPLSARALAVQPFLALDALIEANRLEAEGRDILHLEIGQPRLPPPAPALTATAAAVAAGQGLGYTEAGGDKSLRAQIAAYYGTQYGVDLDPGRVFLAMGSSGALITAFLSLFDGGDRVGVMRPGYPAYARTLRVLGMQTVDIPLRREADFRLELADLEALEGQVDGLMLSNPNNPTGTMIADDDLRAILDWAKARGVKVILDEIYHGLTFEHQPISALNHTDEVVITNGFSKTFNMTGFRLGWLVVPQAACPVVANLLANLYVAPPTLAQIAAAAVLADVSCTRPLVDLCAGNRTLLRDGLLAAGFPYVAPADGAFYLWADCTHLGDDSQQVAHRLLHDRGIAVTPGADFDEARGRQYIRLSYAGAREEMEAAVARLMAQG